jgi:hypothetical protein
MQAEGIVETGAARIRINRGKRAESKGETALRQRLKIVGDLRQSA